MADAIDTDAIRDEINTVGAWQWREWIEKDLLPEVDRLRERTLGYARQLAELREENARLVIQCDLYRTALAHPRQLIEGGA